MATREDFIDIYDTLPACYNIGEIEVEPEPIAEGVFGTLHRGRWGGRAVAVKKFDLENTNRNYNLAAKEMSRMIRLRHQNVLKVYGFYFVAEGLVLKCSIVMELMDFDLYKYVEQDRLALRDDEVVYVIAEIARGMKHVHENGVSHRDLKPQNVLMRRSAVLTGFHPDVKVADFGSSELMSAVQFDQNVGTSGYRAPEQFSGDASCRRDKLDVYSFGCICFKLWTGEDPPFKNHARLMDSWKQRRARTLLGDVEDMITKCLDGNPEARPVFSEISRDLDAILRKIQVEQVPPWEDVTDKEAADLMVRRREIARKVGLGPDVHGIDYAECIILPEELRILRPLTQGSASAVYLVDYKGVPPYKLGTLCVLKVIYTYDSDHYRAANLLSIKTLPTLIHDNIVIFLGYSLDTFESMGRMGLGILMEYLHSDLYTYLVDFRGRPPIFLEQVRWKIMKGIAEGMKFLHDKGWVHGDLKPGNVLVNINDNDVVVKLIDFDLVGGLYVTTYYAAPEVLEAWKDRSLQGRVDNKKVDVYSFAIICSDMLCGVSDNYASSPLRFKAQVIGGMRPQLPKETSQDLQDLITRCWSHDPNERPSFGVICDFFSQPMPVQHSKRFQDQCKLM